MALHRADLDLLVAVADEGSLTGAAERLHTAQPALSRRLKRLESDLGVVLFDRGRRGATATPAGRSVVAAARDALLAVEATEAVGRRAEAGEVGVLRVGTTPTLGADVLPAALADFRSTHADVRLELTTSGDSAQLRHEVGAGRIDVAVAVTADQPEPGSLAIRTSRQPFVIVMPPDLAAEATDPLPRDELSRLPLVALHRGEGLRLLLDSLIAELGGEPTIAIETTEREMLVPFVAAGLGITLVPATFARQRAGAGMVVADLDPPVWREVGVIVRAGTLDPLVESFVARFDDWELEAPAGPVVQ